MKSSPAFTSFNGGEFSPRMDARADFDKYPAAVSRGKNLITLPQGGLTFCPGTRFVIEVKTSSDGGYIVPFESVAGEGYVLELGSLYMRFCKAQARLSAADITATITNGTFGSDISGWTNRSTGTAAISFSSGRMLLDGSADGYAWAEQSIALGAHTNVQHVVRFEVTGTLGSSITVQIGTATVSDNLVSAKNMGLGWHTLAFTSPSTPVFLQFINKANDNVFIDNVSILDNEPIEITTPWAMADVSALRPSQINDLLYFWHDDYPPYKLERRGDTSWSLVKVPFEDGPWGDINPDIDLSATNLIKNGSFDGGLTDWEHEGDFVNYDGAQGVVFLRRRGDSGYGRIWQAVATGASSAVHVAHFQIVGSGKIQVKVGTAADTDNIFAATEYIPGWYSIEFTPTATFYLQFKGDQHETIIGGVGGVFVYNSRSNLLEATGLTGSVTVTALADFAPFATTDVGRMIRLEWAGREPGWGIITAFGTSQSVTVFVRRKLASLVPTETWRLGSWSDTTGWPHCATFHQQRLMPARTTFQPQTIWGSVAGDFENMRPDTWSGGAITVEDDNALDFTLSSKKVSAIQWMAGSARRLLVGTATGQWAITSRGAALTPQDFNAEQQTSVPGNDQEPVAIDNLALFVERAKQAVNDIGYDYEIDGFRAADLNILADHIADDIRQIVYQARPYGLVWARKADGTLAVMTYKRQQNVVGWTPVVIAASSAGAAVVEALAVIPGAVISGTQVYDSDERDELWLLVRRTINGSTKRYIEVMEGFWKGPNRAEYETKSSWQAAVLAAQVNAFYVGCGITQSSGGAVTAISGLSHLEGQTVKVVGAGLVQADKTVASGAITAATAATKFHVGLGYDWVYRSLKLPYGSQTGPGIGQTKTVYEIVPVLLDAYTFQYGIDHDEGDLSFFDQTDHVSAGTLFTGEVPKLSLDGGHSTDPRLWMKSSQPMPFTMIALVAKVVESEK